MSWEIARLLSLEEEAGFFFCICFILSLELVLADGGVVEESRGNSSSDELVAELVEAAVVAIDTHESVCFISSFMMSWM